MKVALLFLYHAVFGSIRTYLGEGLAWLKSKLQASPDKTAQFAHVGIGASLVFVLALLFLPTWASVELVILFAFLKEFVEYKWGAWEPKDTLFNSVRDLVYWCVGVAIALVTLLVR